MYRTVLAVEMVVECSLPFLYPSSSTVRHAYSTFTLSVECTTMYCNGLMYAIRAVEGYPIVPRVPTYGVWHA